MGSVPGGGLPEEARHIFFELGENGLYRYFEPEPGLFMAESLTVIGRALDAGYEPVMALFEEGGAAAAGRSLLEGRDIPVYELAPGRMRELAGYALTGGALAVFRRRRPLGVLSPEWRRIAVLADVENPTNVGAVFRSGAALGLDAVVLLGGCADPLQRRSIRVSMGNVLQIPWFREKDMAAGISRIKEAGFGVLSMALSPEAVPIQEVRWESRRKWALVLGNERFGIPEEILSGTDGTVIIPMAREVDSLNVAAAGAIGFWEMWRGTGWN